MNNFLFVRMTRNGKREKSNIVISRYSLLKCPSIFSCNPTEPTHVNEIIQACIHPATAEYAPHAETVAEIFKHPSACSHQLIYPRKILIIRSDRTF